MKAVTAILASYLSMSLASAGEPPPSARPMYVAGIVVTTLGIVAAAGLLISGGLLGECIAARRRSTGEGCIPEDLDNLKALTGFTGGLTAVGLGVGVPLWAVGASRRARVRLSVAPHVDGGLSLQLAGGF